MADQTDIRPALTAEEWAYLTERPKIYAAAIREAVRCTRRIGYDATQHGTAALCLYGQPFGFTREDVARLREPPELYGGLQNGRDDVAWYGFCSDLADRIAALLPPE